QFTLVNLVLGVVILPPLCYITRNIVDCCLTIPEAGVALDYDENLSHIVDVVLFFSGAGGFGVVVAAQGQSFWRVCPGVGAVRHAVCRA
ncbi:MAG TPA: hypothetical protein PLE92_08465, partial [Lentisphaeria bacterium]|nr:hypothetical protein [Lentisphaeria bacterium]